MEKLSYNYPMDFAKKDAVDATKVDRIEEIAAICDTLSWHSGSGMFEVKEDFTPEDIAGLKERLHAQELARNPVCAAVFSVGKTSGTFVQVIAHNLDGC